MKRNRKSFTKFKLIIQINKKTFIWIKKQETKLNQLIKTLTNLIINLENQRTKTLSRNIKQLKKIINNLELKSYI